MTGIGAPAPGAGAGAGAGSSAEAGRRRLRSLLVAVAAAVVTWEVLVAAVPIPSSPLVDLDPPNLLLIAVVLVCTVAAARRSALRTRRAWAVLTLVVAIGALGDLIYSVLDVLGATPTVSISDIVYLAGYPFLLVALWWLARSRGGQAGVQAMFDGLLLAAGLSLLAWQVLSSTLDLFGDTVDVSTATLLTYPILDLLLLGAAVGVVLSSRRLDAAVAWLGGYLVLTVVGDVVFLVGALRVEEATAWSTVAYASAYACLGLAATSPTARSLADPSAGASEIGRARFFILGASMVAPALTAGVVLASGEAVAVPVLIGSTAVVAVLVSWRVAGAVRSERAARAASERARRELLQRSRQDPLTGLGNRSALLEDLPGLAGAVALLFVDLDRFKQVNDTSGHAAGDEVLREVTNRLQGALLPDERIYRLSGDEFVIVHRIDASGRSEPGMPYAQPGSSLLDLYAAAVTGEVRERAHQVVELLGRPYFPSGMEWHLSASVGCALSVSLDSGTAAAEDCLRRADIAMYHAKRERPGSVRVFDAAMQRELDAERELELGLRRAVADSAFVPAVQPIVDLADGRIVGFEALARWQQPDGSVVPAGGFIDVAERAGLLPSIQRQVVDKALEFIRSWQQASPERRGAYLAVNASATELVEQGYVESLLDQLARARIGPDSLVVELTEGAMVAAPEVVASRLSHLRRLGIRVALDDFGTGYSSLSHLVEFAVDIVKIDRTFIAELTTAVGPNSVTSATYRLAETLGLDVVAEGVETTEQLQILLDIGISRAQGFGLERPLLVDAAAALPSHLTLPSTAPLSSD